MMRGKGEGLFMKKVNISLTPRPRQTTLFINLMSYPVYFRTRIKRSHAFIESTNQILPINCIRPILFSGLETSSIRPIRIHQSRINQFNEQT